MKPEWKTALETTFSKIVTDQDTIDTDHGRLSFIAHDKWLEPVLALTNKWGYHTPNGWKDIDSLSLFPPMTHGFEEEEWFDPYRYSELLYIKILRVMEFINDNPLEKYELIRPKLTDNNNIYFQVMNLNSKWSSMTNSWTFDPDFTVFINGMVYPVAISTTSLIEMVTTQKLLEVGTKITPKRNIQMNGMIITI